MRIPRPSPSNTLDPFYGFQLGNGFNLWTWLLVNAGWCSLYRCFFNVLHVSWCFILFLLYIRKGCMYLCFLWLLNVTPILILFTTASFLWDKESRAIFTFIPMYFCLNSPRGQQRVSFSPLKFHCNNFGKHYHGNLFSFQNEWLSLQCIIVHLFLTVSLFFYT